MRRRKFNKVISLLLVIVTVISLNITVFAEGTDNVNVNNTSTEVIDTEEKTDDTVVVEDKTDKTDTINETDVSDIDVKTEDNSNIETDKNVEDNNTVTEEKNDVSKVEVKTNDVNTNIKRSTSRTVEIAEVNGTNYNTISEAINNANGQTVKLIADVTEDVTIPEGKTITLDLAGHKLIGTGASKASVITNEGNFTLIDSVGGGEVWSSEISTYYVINNHGEMTLGSQSGNNQFAIGAKSATNPASIVKNGWDTDGGDSKPVNKTCAKMIIYGGTYTGQSASCQVIKNDEYSDLTIYDGTFVANSIATSHNTIISYGKLTIYDGIFEKKGTTSIQYCINIEKSKESIMISEAEIYGGDYKINANNGQTVRANADATLKIYGGVHNISTCLSDYIVEEKTLVELKIATKTKYYYINSIADALQKAQEASFSNKTKTITLLKNTAENIVIPENLEITLNLNGFELTNKENEHTIINNGILTINGTSTNSKIINTSNQKQAIYSSNQLKITTSGIIEGNITAGQGDIDIKNTTIIGTVSNNGDGNVIVYNCKLEDYDGKTNIISCTVKDQITTKVLDSDAVAYVSNTGQTYTTLAEALKKVSKSSTIVVLKDTEWETTSSYISITKTMTIDLNGYSVTLYKKINNERGYTYFSVGSSSMSPTLTIRDSNSNQGGILRTENSPSDDSTKLIDIKKGTLELKGGHLQSDCDNTIVISGNSITNTVLKMYKGSIVSNSKELKETDKEGKIDRSSAIALKDKGTLTINGGLIKTTNETNSVYGIEAEDGKITINDCEFDTGETASIFNNSTSSTIKIIKATNASIKTIKTATNPIEIGTTNGTDELKILKLEMDSNGYVNIHDNVIISKVIALGSKETGNSYSFYNGNQYGGKYGNDFTQYIIGNGLQCKLIPDSEYYQVEEYVLTGDDDPLAVAKITDSNGNSTYYGEIRQAFAELQNGGKLTLLKNIEYDGTESLTSQAMSATIDLNGHDIISKSSSVGVTIGKQANRPTSDDSIHIIGRGTIKGIDYGVKTYSSLKEIGNSVTLAGSIGKVDVGYYGSVLIEGNDIVENECSAKVKTIVDGKNYLFARLDTAISNTTSNAIELTDDYRCNYQCDVTNDAIIDLNLNNHTLTTSSSLMAIVVKGKGLSIRNGTINSTYDNTSQNGFVVGVTEEGTDGVKLTFDKVSIITSGSDVTAITVNENIENAEVSLTNSTIENQYSGDKKDNSVGIYFPVKGGTLDIDDTTIKAANALQVKGGTATIKGNSVITSTGAKGEFDPNSDGCSNTGDAIYVEDNYGFNPTVIIESGTIKSEGTDTHALNLHKVESVDKPATGKIVVSGGSFSEEVKQEYCASGYTSTQGADGSYTVAIAPKMYGYTLTLNGTIGVNFYVNMEGVGDKSAYSMKFIVENENKPREVRFDENEFRVVNNKTYYRFTCPVTAKQMTDIIKATIMKGDTAVSSEYTYSIKQYCNNKKGDAELNKLLEAMLNYGGYAQKKFAYKLDNLANDGLYTADNNPIKNVKIDDLSKYKMVKSDSNPPKGISDIGVTLSLQSDVIMRFYIYLDQGADINNYTFAIDGKTYTPILDSTQVYYIELEGINARELTKMYTLSVGDYSVSYSALSYVYNKFDDSDNDLVNVVKALYLYSKAAEEYTGWLE